MIYTMENVNIKFQKMNMEKSTVAFTWDDNFLRHYKYIAPEFLKRNLRCTFYVNPGESEFEQIFKSKYLKLSKSDFEIGSHGFVHNHYSKIEESDFLQQLVLSYKYMGEFFEKYPTTFAFPHHDYNSRMLEIAKKKYFETRNTLAESIYFGLKTNISVENMVNYIDSCIPNKPIIFAGHSVYINQDELKTEDIAIKKEIGYKPILLSNLSMLLDYIISKKNIDILTFEQAVVKSFILKNCNYNYKYFTISKQQLLQLNSYKIDINKIQKIV